MKYAKHVPNALSIFRLIASFSLLPITQISNVFTMRVVFTAMYLLVNLTDALDGWIARRYHFQSEFGAKIDNIADTCVFCTSFVSLLVLIRPPFVPSLLHNVIPLAIGIGLKIFSFVLTRIRFGQWNSMHTYSNKALGIVLVTCVPVCLWLGKIHYIYTIAVMACTAATSLEDIYILMTSDTYNVNHKGLLFERRGLADKH